MNPESTEQTATTSPNFKIHSAPFMDYNMVTAGASIQGVGPVTIVVELNGYRGGKLELKKENAKGFYTGEKHMPDAQLAERILKSMGFTTLSNAETYTPFNRMTQKHGEEQMGFAYDMSRFETDLSAPAANVEREQLWVSPAGLEALHAWAESTGAVEGEDWTLVDLAQQALDNQDRPLEVSIGNKHYAIAPAHVIEADLFKADFNRSPFKPTSASQGTVHQFFNCEELGITNVTWATADGDSISLSGNHLDWDEGTNLMSFKRHSDQQSDLVYFEATHEARKVLQEVREAAQQGRAISPDIGPAVMELDAAIQAQITESQEMYERARLDSEQEASGGQSKKNHGMGM